MISLYTSDKRSYSRNSHAVNKRIRNLINVHKTEQSLTEKKTILRLYIWEVIMYRANVFIIGTHSLTTCVPINIAVAIEIDGE